MSRYAVLVMIQTISSSWFRFALIFCVFLAYIDLSYAEGSGKLIKTIDIPSKGETGSILDTSPIEESSTGNTIKPDSETPSKPKTSLLEEEKSSAEKIEEETKLKQDINTYIIESYKAQGSKIVKELSTKLGKTIPDTKDRQEAYKKIQSSLESRAKRTERLKISETKKMILSEFLDHIIDLLDKKIEELE